MTTGTVSLDISAFINKCSRNGTLACDNNNVYDNMYQRGTTKSAYLITKSNLASLIPSSPSESDITSIKITVTGKTGLSSASCDYGISTVYTGTIGIYDTNYLQDDKTLLNSTTTPSSTSGTASVTATISTISKGYVGIILTGGPTGSDYNYLRTRLTGVEVTYNVTCSISAKTEISEDNVTFEENTSSTPLEIERPKNMYFKGTASCNDSSCGSISSCSWALRKGTGTSGTILQNNTSYSQGTSEGVLVSNYGSYGTGIYNIVFVATGCNATTYNGQVFFNLNSAIQSYGVSYDNGSTWYSPQSGTTYYTDSPRNALIQFNDTWGGYYLLYFGYKLSTASEYSWTSHNANTFTETLALRRNVIYDIQLAYGDSSGKTEYKSFQLGVRDPVTHGYINVNSGSYTEITNASSNPVEVPTTTSTTVGYKYTNTYGSTDNVLRIYVDSVLVATSTTTTATYSQTYTSNGNHTISYRVYDGTSESTSYTFTVSVMGIFINTNARINVDGTAIWTNISKDVAQFGDQLITITGLTGLDLAGTSYVWAVTELDGTALVEGTDYVISYSTTQSPTVKFNNSSIQYRLTCVISYTRQYGSSAGTTIQMVELTFGPSIQTTSTMGYVTCSGKTIAKIQSMNRHEGDTTTEFNVFGKAIKPTASGDVSIQGVWSIKQGTTTLTEGTDYTKLSDPVIPSGSTANCSFGFRMNVNGEFTVYLTTVAVTSYTSGTDKEDFKVFNITTMELPMECRHSIVLYNDSYTCVINRRSDSTHTTIYDQLTFSSGLNKTGSASFNIIGGNSLTCNVWDSTTSTFTNYNASSLIANNTKVIIVDNDCPIWTGVVTSVDQVNVNFYNSLVNTSIIKVTCEESTKELSYIYTTSKIYSGTIGDIAEELLDDYAGDIGSALTNYSISFDVSSILSALDSLSNQVGWRYRCKPYIGSYGNSFIVSSGTYSVTHGTVSVGDYIIIYDGSISSTTTHPYAYTEGYYHVAKIRTITSGSSTDTVTFSSYQSMPSSNGTYKFSTCKGFLVDFKPAYYQEYVPMSYKINDVAQNVNAIDTATDKFGEVSVYGVGNSGETISSTMRAWMTIEKDYTIPCSARIITSYDSTIDSISMTQQYKATYQSVTEYIYSEFTVTLNGWSFPTDTALITAHSPTIFYKSGSTILSMILSSPMGISINRFTDQSGMNKTTVTCAYPVTMGDGTAISSSDRYARDTNGRLYADILSSLASQTNVVFNIFKVDSGNDVITDVLTTGSVRIGDSEVTCTSINASGDLIFNWITSSSMPHGHMTDVLVIDNTGNKYPSGCSYSNPAIDSPYVKYPNVKKTIQGAEGYSAMELERLSCRYMQYGSNYDSEGSADIIYNEFKRSDYAIGCIRTPSVGDRIQFEKVVNVTSSGTEYNLLNFELITYSVDLSKNMASVTFGMPFVEIGDILYNMLSNSGMSIIPATNSTGS